MNSYNHASHRGFTLVELIVVIAIIGLLATIGISSYNNILNEAKMTKLLTQIEDIKKAAAAFNIQTSTWPANYNGYSGTNEFISGSTAPGWAGPYLESWPEAHPWGGGVVWRNYDPDNDGVTERVLFLDDDEPGTTATNDQGWISQSAMEEIDERIDDGDLSTGKVRGNGGFSSAPNGELVVIIFDE